MGARRGSRCSWWRAPRVTRSPRSRSISATVCICSALKPNNRLMVDVVEYDRPVYDQYQVLPDLFTEVSEAQPVRFVVDIERRTIIARHEIDYRLAPDFRRIRMRTPPRVISGCSALQQQAGMAASFSISWCTPIGPRGQRATSTRHRHSAISVANRYLLAIRAIRARGSLCVNCLMPSARQALLPSSMRFRSPGDR